MHYIFLHMHYMHYTKLHGMSCVFTDLFSLFLSTHIPVFCSKHAEYARRPSCSPVHMDSGRVFAKFRPILTQQ